MRMMTQKKQVRSIVLLSLPSFINATMHQAQPRRLFSDEELKIELKQMFQFENPDASLTQQILEEYLNKFKRYSYYLYLFVLTSNSNLISQTKRDSSSISWDPCSLSSFKSTRFRSQSARSGFGWRQVAQHLGSSCFSIWCSIEYES